MEVDEIVRLQVIEYLQGTCMSIAECAASLGLDEDYVDHCVTTNQEIELCSRCGWWYELNDMHELDGEQVCVDCLTEDEQLDLDI